MASVKSGTEGADTITNYDSNIIIRALGGRDSIINRQGGYTSEGYGSPDNVTIDAGEGNDTIRNGYDFFGGNYTSINGGDGNDYISNHSSSFVTIDGGAGSDTINNWSSDGPVTINGGAGNDSIFNDTSNVSINAGAGNDTIKIKSISSNFPPYSITIEGGTGDDLVDNSYSGSDILYKYKSGDGNDIISTFNADDTLQIDGGTGTYGTIASDDGDIIVYVGNGSIVLIGAASLEEVNIAGVESELPIWRLNGTTATYGTSTNAQITINGVKSLDGISLSGTTVTIANSSLNQGTVTINSGYTLALADDVTRSTATGASWNFSGNTATYTTPITTAGYSLNNNRISYVSAGGGEQITIDGVKSTSGLSVSGNVITVANSALNQATVTVSDSNYTLALSNNVATPEITAASWSISGTTATYKTASTSAGYTLNNNQIIYSEASGGEEIKISGVKSLDGVSISGNVITVANSALNQATVTVSDSNYRFSLADDVTAPETSAATWTTSGTMATYRGGTTTAGYSIVNNEIVYTPSSSGETFTISGVNSTNGISVEGKIVTLPQSALGQSVIMISDNNYTLALGTDVIKSETTAAGWSISGTTATYKTASTSAGYTVNNNQVSYVNSSGGESLVSVSGVNSENGLSLSGNVVTVGAAALGTQTVTISNGYNLALANDVTKSETTEAKWNISGNTATYTSAKTTAGYTLADNEINYVTAGGGETLLMISGIKSTDGLSINGNVVTVAAASLGTETITISGDYELKLADDVTKSETIPADWTINNNVATYKNSSTSAGYKLENNQISYVSASSGEEIKVSGVKDTDGLALNGTIVTVGNAALNKLTVTVSDGYTLALGSDVTESKTTPASWTYSNGKATYVSKEIAMGYRVVDNRIIYTSDSGGGEEMTISGVKVADINNVTEIAVDGWKVTVEAAALTEQNVTVSEGYELVLGEGISASTTTKADWTFDKNVATYKNAATIAGYALDGKDTITYTPANGGDTVVAVSGVTGSKGLTINQDEKIVAVYSAALDKNNTVTANNDYTLELGTDVDTSSTDDFGSWVDLENGNMAYQTGTTAGYKVEDNQIIYVEAVTGERIAEMSGLSKDSLPTVDDTGISLAAESFEDNVSVISSEILKFELLDGDYADNAFSGTSGSDKINNAGENILISGAAGNDKIFNGGSNVSVEGGAGNDNVSLNGDNQIFIYNSGDGKDILYNFSEDDKIQILGINSASDIGEELKNNDVILKVGRGTITIRDAAKSDMAIEILDSDGKTLLENTYTTNGIIREEDAIELSASLKKQYKQPENISTVDGSLNKSGLRIEGNDEGGTLIGGGGKDTLISTESNFELKGGKGNDLFIFGGGDDIITDYEDKDKISIAGGLSYIGYEIEGSDVILNYANDNSLTIADGKGTVITFAGRKSTSRIYDDVGVFDGKRKSVTLSADIENSTFDASKGKNYSKLVTIDGGAITSAMSINGNKKANYIIAGEGNTTLNGGKGKDTLVGGEGEDIFVYENKSGNKIIRGYDFERGDKISLGSGASISQVTTKKSNVVLKVGSNTITVEGMATSEFIFVENGKEKTYDNGKLVSDKSATLASNFKESFDLNNYEIYDHVSAELGKKAVTLIGDEADNSLTGGKGKDSLYGGSGNDTLWGGKGNDFLWGDDDADVFVYRAGEGTDTILDYNVSDGDLLKIIDKNDANISASQLGRTYQGNDLVLSVKGGGKVILADFLSINGSNATPQFKTDK